MEKKGLGRGLSALIPGSETPQGGVTEISIDSITLNPWQPRRTIDEVALQELSDSIQRFGVIQPIVVRPGGDGKYQLIAGERRLRASRLAGLKEIPAIVRESQDQESLELALIENIQREDINPLDAAVAYRRLMDEFDLSQEEIAKRVGKSRSAVANTLRLLQLPASVQALVEQRKISEGHARAVLQIQNPNAQVLVAEDIARRGCSVREAERLARNWAIEALGPAANPGVVSRETSTSADTEVMETHLVAVEEQLKQLFGTRVRVSIAKDRGKIEIEFYGEDDLNRILTLVGAIPSSSGYR